MPLKEEFNSPLAPPEVAQIGTLKIKLNPGDRRILACKLQHPEFGPKEIANYLGINRTYVWRRMTCPDLRLVFETVNELILHEAKDTMIAASTEAVQTAVSIMRGVRMTTINGVSVEEIDHQTTPQVRLSAAKLIIESLKGYKGKENEGEEIVYEMVVDAVGMIKQTKVKQLATTIQDDPVHLVMEDAEAEPPLPDNSTTIRMENSMLIRVEDE